MLAPLPAISTDQITTQLAATLPTPAVTEDPTSSGTTISPTKLQHMPSISSPKTKGSNTATAISDPAKVETSTGASLMEWRKIGMVDGLLWDVTGQLGTGRARIHIPDE
ncbi:MAG: hypothetical protein Q9221_000784 [Calogaya cf. arnoldii]